MVLSVKADLDVEQAYDAVFEILGFRFRVRSSSPSWEAAVDRVFGLVRSADDEPAPTYVLGEWAGRPEMVDLDLDDTMLLRGASPGQAFSQLIWHVMRQAIEASTGLLLIHAGVASRDGRAVLLPASSGAGKSTLVAGLVQAGWSFLSDEIAAIDPGTGLVHPVPRSIIVKRGSVALLGSLLPDLPPDVGRYFEGIWPIRPDEVHDAALGEPAPVGSVVSITYQAGASTTLVPCSKATAVFEMARNAFNIVEMGPRETLRACAEIASAASCYRLESGSLDEAVATLTANSDARR